MKTKEMEAIRDLIKKYETKRNEEKRLLDLLISDPEVAAQFDKDRWKIANAYIHAYDKMIVDLKAFGRYGMTQHEMHKQMGSKPHEIVNDNPLYWKICRPEDNYPGNREYSKQIKLNKAEAHHEAE